MAGRGAETFYVHRNHPLAIVKLHHETVFAPLIPWLFDSFRMQVVDKALASKTWEKQFDYSSKDSVKAVEALRTLPFNCFRFGTMTERPTGDAPQFVRTNPFHTSDWVPVLTYDLIVAMRLIITFKKYMDQEQNPQPSILPNSNPLPQELLDRELPINHTLTTVEEVPRPVLVFRPSSDPPPADAPKAPVFPLTLRRLIGMLTGLAFVSREANELLEAKHMYISTAGQSPYFIAHQHDIAKRIDVTEWRVVVTVDGKIYSPRVSSIDAMQELYKHLEETMITNRVMGPGTAI